MRPYEPYRPGFGSTRPGPHVPFVFCLEEIWLEGDGDFGSTEPNLIEPETRDLAGGRAVGGRFGLTWVIYNMEQNHLWPRRCHGPAVGTRAAARGRETTD